MTGPEHYLAAEKLLRSCQLSPELDHPDDAPTYPALEEDEPVNACANALAAAQVHATLALAAAQAAVLLDQYVELDEAASAWVEVLG